MAKKGILMRYFWVFIIVIGKAQSLQPPDERTFLKSQELSQALNKLRLGYQGTVDTNFATVQAYLFQKSDEFAGISQSNFGGAVKKESDEIIQEQLAQMTKHLLDMHKLEEQLIESQCAKAKGLLELDRQHATHQQIQELQKKLFESIMQLSYHQTIRIHQKVSEFHDKLAKASKP